MGPPTLRQMLAERANDETELVAKDASVSEAMSLSVAHAKAYAEAEAKFRRLDLNIEQCLKMSVAINVRRSAMAMQIPTVSFAVVSGWIAMHVAAYTAKVTQLASIAPIFPAIGLVMCIVYIMRDAALYREEGSLLWAAVESARKRWGDAPSQWEFEAAHVAGLNHMGRYRGSPTPVDSAVFWPMVAFTVFLGVEYFYGKMLFLPTGPV